MRHTQAAGAQTALTYRTAFLFYVQDSHSANDAVGGPRALLPSIACVAIHGHPPHPTTPPPPSRPLDPRASESRISRISHLQVHDVLVDRGLRPALSLGQAGHLGGLGLPRPRHDTHAKKRQRHACSERQCGWDAWPAQPQAPCVSRTVHRMRMSGGRRAPHALACWLPTLESDLPPPPTHPATATPSSRLGSCDARRRQQCTEHGHGVQGRTRSMGRKGCGRCTTPRPERPRPAPAVPPLASPPPAPALRSRSAACGAPGPRPRKPCRQRWVGVKGAQRLGVSGVCVWGGRWALAARWWHGTALPGLRPVHAGSATAHSTHCTVQACSHAAPCPLQDNRAQGHTGKNAPLRLAGPPPRQPACRVCGQGRAGQVQSSPAAWAQDCAGPTCAGPLPLRPWPAAAAPPTPAAPPRGAAPRAPRPAATTLQPARCPRPVCGCGSGEGGGSVGWGGVGGCQRIKGVQQAKGARDGSTPHALHCTLRGASK